MTGVCRGGWLLPVAGESDSADRMGEWIRCADAFLPGDVIRWTEDVKAYPEREEKPTRATPEASSRRERNSRRGAKVEGVRIGERLVTAQVERERNRPGFVCLRVLDCEVTWEKRKGLALGLPVEKRIDRAEGTLYKGPAQRRVWEDENVRAFLIQEAEAEGILPAASGNRPAVDPDLAGYLPVTVGFDLMDIDPEVVRAAIDVYLKHRHKKKAPGG